ncbi:MAG: hypothetical protein H0X33_07270 [Taibaiella sp.]|nr:hypothetical protein [Taibaiella sp.]
MVRTISRKREAAYQRIHCGNTYAFFLKIQLLIEHRIYALANDTGQMGIEQHIFVHIVQAERLG